MDAGRTTQPVKGFIPAVIRCRLLVLALWLIAIVASGVVYLTHFRIDNSVAIWFLDDDPELADYRLHNAAFGEHEWTYIWLRGDPVFTSAFLRDLQVLADRIESIDGVTQVVSLAEVAGLGSKSGENGDLLDEDELIELRERIRGSPLLEGRLVPKANDRFTILAFQNANRIHATEPYRIELIDQVRAAIEANPSILDSGIVGTTVVNAELNRAAKRDMLVYSSLIAVFVLIGGGIALGSGKDLIVLVAVVIGTVLPVLGTIGMLQIPFNLITVMLPTLLVTVSVSYLIHFITDFHACRRAQVAQGGPVDSTSAISTTFSNLWRPGFWTSLTTATGFASLTVSPVAPIQQFGLFAAIGIGIAWLATITLAPALLSLLRHSGSRAHRRDTATGGETRPLRWLEKPRSFLAVCLGTAMLFGAFGVVWLEADTNYVKFFRPGSEVRSDYAQLEQLGMPASYLTLTLNLPKDTGVSNYDRHRTMRRFEQSLLALPSVLEVDSLDHRVAELSSGFEGEAEIGSIRLMLERAGAGELEMAADFLSEDKKLLRLRVMINAMSTRDIGEFRTALSGLSADLPDDWDLTLTGTNVLWSNMDAHVVRTQLLSIGITAAVLLTLLPLVFRSFLLGILGFAVSFLPVLCTLGVMGWLGLPVNIATCILGGVVMGVAVDDTIYYLSRFREGLHQGLSADAAARGATATTGRAMIKTSFILTGGFLMMAVSDFMPSVYFGVFFSFSILAALLADLIVLPVLLRLMAPRHGK